MSGIKTAVAESQDVEDAALNLIDKANEIRQTLAAIWKLKPTRAQPPAPEATFSLDMKNESEESVFGDDKRRLVNKIHFAPGGKYRCKSAVTALCRYASLRLLYSHRKALHPLRVSEVWKLGHGYWLAYQA